MSMVPAPVSVEAYLRGEYEPDAEYVDGEIEERPVGEYDHAAWQRAILAWFMQHEQSWQITALQELRVQVAPTRFRVPDVTVLDRRRPVEQIVTLAPVAVFEVLSPQDTFRRLTRKLEDYAAMRIGQIWVMDPDDRKFRRYAGGELRIRDAFGEPGEAMYFDWGEINRFLPQQG